MKQNLILIILIISFNISKAQKEANIWYFGDHVGLDFNNEPPTPLTDSKMYSRLNGSVISDSTGKLLLYTDGDTVWNNEHKIVENGTGLCVSGKYVSSGIPKARASIIAKQPLSSRYYYIFCATGVVEYLNEGVFYSIIDIKANGGKGKVIVKRKLIVDKSAGKIALVKHANKKDIWVAIEKGFSDTLFVFLLTEKGLSPTVLKHRIYMKNEGSGRIKFSPNGKLLAMSNLNNKTSTYLYDFDNRAGSISNERRIHNITAELEFSPNSKYLYLSHGIYTLQCPVKNITNNFLPDSNCYKFDINIRSSLQLAPNGKIYNDRSGFDSTLSVINYPNLKGIKCKPEILRFNSHYNWYFLGYPSFMSSYFNTPSFTYKSRCINEPTHFILLDSNDNDSIKWIFGDSTSGAENFSTKEREISHTYKAYGSYTASLITYYNNRPDTTSQIITFKNPEPDFSTSDVCENDSVKFINKTPSNTGEMKYKWKFGDGQQSYEDSPKYYYKTDGISTTYNVTLVASMPDGCFDSIVKPVTVNANPVSDFNYKNNSNTVEFKAVQGVNTTYIWTFGNGDSAISKDASYTFNKSGKYTVCLKAINAAECSTKTCKDINITVAIQTINPKLKFQIFPNPGKGLFEVQMGKNSDEINIEIFNSIGKIVYSEKLNAQAKYTFKLDTSPGIYFVRVNDNGNYYSQKIVLNKE
ncbi:MAG: PKD domain-containing protein [Bacteroidetes bacterium]|nr:PKD domain-containing protein [Bacteroidota bacterium]